jgi:drug/metabolite transporter (DMT)-like permease
MLSLLFATLGKPYYIFAFQYAGVEYTSAGNASIIVSIHPIFVAILALFLLIVPRMFSEVNPYRSVQRCE